jgi:hypothetical protein
MDPWFVGEFSQIDLAAARPGALRARDYVVFLLVKSFDIQIVVNERLGNAPDDQINPALPKLPELGRRTFGIVGMEHDLRMPLR